MISQQTIDSIFSAASITDVISDFVSLKRRGINYIGCCPFHNEKTPSFVVSPVKNIYHCFGCGKGGNVFQFIQEHETVPFPEAVKIVGKKYNIEVKETELTPEEKDKLDRRESLRAANNIALEYFKKELINPSAEKYINERGINPESVEKFKIGFAPGAWNGFYTIGKTKGLSEQVMFDASLVNKGDKGYYDRFRNRVMFPFLDLYGNVIGFTGRLIEKNDKEPKYLNSSDTELFKKGNVLFGLHQAKRAISDADKCFLVEGNIDVVMMHQCGISNTVCGSGTALTIEQIRLIHRFTNNITVIYDGDAAGIRASFKNIDLLLQEGINVRAVSLPDGEDPDSFARKHKPEDLLKWIHNNEHDFITFKHAILKEDASKDPIKEAELVKEILHSISIIADPVTRDLYKKQCVDKFKIAEEVVNTEIKKQPRKAKEVVSGWIGLDIVHDSIAEYDEIFLVSDLQRMYAEWEEGNDNTIAWAGDIKNTHLQELNRLSGNIIVLDSIDKIYNTDDTVKPIISLCKKFFEFGFNIKVERTIKLLFDDVDKDNIKSKTDQVSFLQFYFDLAKDYVEEYEYDQLRLNKCIEEAAELFSKADNTTINISCKSYAAKLGIKEGDFKKILKPYQEKQKSRSTAQTEIVDENEKMQLDPDRLPDYVDKNFFSKWGYFPYQNKKGEKVRYVFRTQEGGLQPIGNFYFEPLFHVYDIDPAKNKRVIRVNNADLGRSFYMEMISGNMADFGVFKKVLFNEGGNVFTRGKSNHHEIILASTANQFPICYEFNTFGQQHEGFWAFTNAIFANGEITYMDDLGLVRFDNNMYYSPAFSKIYSGQRKDNDKYEQDRFFVYKENDKTTFEDWASLMDQVYYLNDNGKWAILMTIMSAFRSIIYPIDGNFTTLFFIGPTESGKTQIAMSIRSMYIKYDAPLFNLNSGSDAAFFTLMERYRDVPVLFEEYNDYQISDIKFQGLKAAVYDGQGKQKRKDATSKEIDVSKVNVVPILLGQEGPERDDGSLGNRCILNNVPKKDDWTEEENTRFRTLKDMEKQGLTHILIEILKQRGVVSKNFQKIHREIFNKMKDEMNKNGLPYQTRILNTVSLFTAICYLWERHVPQLKLPFKADDFYTVAKAKIVAQSEAITSTNRVSVFFDTIELLLNRAYNGLTPGKEFKIDVCQQITVQKNRNETEEINFEKPTRVLYLRLNILHPMYSDVRKAEALKYNNLVTYLHDHPSYLGAIKSTRFNWTEIHDQADALSGNVTKKGIQASANTSAFAFNYEKLTEMLDIDLDKFSVPDDKVQIEPTQPDEVAQPEQQSLFDQPKTADDLPF